MAARKLAETGLCHEFAFSLIKNTPNDMYVNETGFI